VNAVTGRSTPQRARPRRDDPVRYHASHLLLRLTSLLSAIGQGERDALGQLYALLYPELRRLAHSRVRRSGDMTLLDTTSLVHESFLRFEKSGAVKMGDRSQFMAYAAQVMRSVVVDVIRRRQSERRGGDAVHVEFDEASAVAAADPRENEVLRVHESLEELAAIDARLVKVVEMRYFSGMTEPEVAEVLGLTVRTVARDWEKARLFLHACLR
jgi:RNA polymerase sigma factor (TIGR02999 family)